MFRIRPEHGRLAPRTVASGLLVARGGPPALRMAIRGPFRNGKNLPGLAALQPFVSFVLFVVANPF